MASESSSVESLRELAELQGVSPSDDDLEAVLDFVNRILPALEQLEHRLSSDAST
jgi:hypothetical protein